MDKLNFTVNSNTGLSKNYLRASLENQTPSTPHIDKHSHLHYEIYFLFNGDVTFYIDSERFDISENTLLFIPPQTYHKTTPYNQSTRKRFCLFIGEELFESCRFKDSSMDISKPFILQLTTVEAKKLNEYFKLLLSEQFNDLHENSSYNKVIKQGLLISLFAEISRIYDKSYFNQSKNDTQNINADIAKVCNYIDSHFTENITLEILSKQIHLTPTYLSSLFKKHMGVTFKEYLNINRINYAVNFLKNSDVTIDVLTYKCGFNSVNCFRKTFTKLVGVSPGAYKSLCKESQL